MPEQDVLRQWLRENEYDNIAELIDGFIEKWKLAGKRTRRNWWEILAGGKSGRPRTIDGIEFPVLKAAQIRQRMPITANAISHRGESSPPAPRESGRWPKRPRKTTLRSVKKKKDVLKLRRARVVVGDFPRSA
jgi:hypothetical protein